MVLVQKLPFFQLFFLGNLDQENMFYDILEQKKKKAFYAVKSKRSESRKIDIFPKGLTHCFGPNMIIFPSFFFKAIKTRKMFFYDILERKNAFLRYKK